jgi:hypothetical protein
VQRCNNPHDILIYGSLPDYINTSLYFVDFTKGAKLFIKDPVVKGLHELYPISDNAQLKLNSIEGQDRIISFNGCIPFHITYSIVDHLTLNNNYPILIPRKEKNVFLDINIDIYTDYWMKKDENNIKQYISENIEQSKIKQFRVNNTFNGYVNHYGIFSGMEKNGNLQIYSNACPVETYLGHDQNFPSVYKNTQKPLNYILDNNIPNSLSNFNCICPSWITCSFYIYDANCDKLFSSDPGLNSQYLEMKSTRPISEVRNLCGNYVELL